MRALRLIPLMLLASPALAQPKAEVADEIRVPNELTDPAMAEKLAGIMQALSRAFLDMPVGEVRAAVEGREPTAEDRRRTVRTETRVSERELQQRIDQSKPAIEAGQRALATALPAMMKALAEAGRELERVGANVPRPDYPKR